MRVMTPSQERRLIAALEMEVRQCIGKERFESPNLAQEVARRMRERHKGAFIQHYRCPHCGKWHVGESYRTSRFRSRGEIRGIRHAG